MNDASIKSNKFFNISEKEQLEIRQLAEREASNFLWEPSDFDVILTISICFVIILASFAFAISHGLCGHCVAISHKLPGLMKKSAERVMNCQVYGKVERIVFVKAVDYEVSTIP